ncbi:MAG: sigma factor, partial [Myxococcota bacterium]
MDKAHREEFEADLSGQWNQDAGQDDFTPVVEMVMRGYGPEILGYLVAVTRDEEQAWDAFSIFSENLWKTMGTFQRRSTFRTWSYMLARQALYQVRVSPPYRQAGDVALDDCSNISKLA